MTLSITTQLENASKLLASYLALEENISSTPIKEAECENPESGLIEKHYLFNSQTWPKGQSEDASVWQHRLVIYCPREVKRDQALLFINSGTRHELPGKENSAAQKLNFAKMALETQSLVIDLQDVPNQYLILNGQPYKGDDLLAYCWRQFLTNPAQSEFWSLYLPMTKAVIKAMDAVQALAEQELKLSIKHFLLSGISKRGLAAWLAALSDSRVSAIVPIAIDILNTSLNFKHIYTSHNNQWPPAFREFMDDKLLAHSSHPRFEGLMRIEDPLSYLQSGNDLYQERFSIPKYLMTASGDDLFVPDSLSLYYDLLPGDNKIRVLPNQSHMVDLKVVEEALALYYQAQLEQKKLPTLQWKRDERGALCQVISDQAPHTVKLWQAENPKIRDFRLAAEIRYQSSQLIGVNEGQGYRYDFHVEPAAQGWKAHFVEFTFGEDNFILTTPAYIIETKS